MEEPNVVIAVFADHQGAEAAVKKLASAGIEMSTSASSVRDTILTKRS
jgi:hypothetical protein